MKTDRELLKEVKMLAGGGSREERFDLLRRIDAARKDRLDGWNWVWASEVLSALPRGITLRSLERAHIDDGLHPTAICDYAGPFIRETTEN